MSEWYERVQGATATVAEHNGEAWESSDIDLVLAFTDEVTDEEIAVATGRTLASIWAIQHRVRQEGAESVRKAYARQSVRAAREEVGYDFVTTFPPGWND